MLGLFDRLSRPLMRALDPEDAHALTIKALRYMPLARAAPDPPELKTRAFGLNFPNPVGLAAGFDKNAQVPDALLRLGFGFVEVGTVTPRAQAGNPRPRLFRLEADQGAINRLGFNNDGAPAALARLAARARAHEGGVVGVNIGANRDSADRAEDYVRLIETFSPVAGYFTVNISSPNTPGLRDLQQAERARRPARPPGRRARARAPAQRPDPGARQDRARPDAARARRRGAASPASTASTA